MKKILFAAALCFTSAVFAQEALKSTEEEYYDFLSLTGVVERPTLGYRTLSDSEWKFIENEDGEIAQHPWQNNNLGTKRTLWQGSEGTNWFTRGFDHSLKLKIYGPEWFNSINTSSPYGQNDGVLWQGKGYNTSLTGGARVEAFGFEVTLKPQVCFSQNLDYFYLPGVYGSEYSYFWFAGIDFVQRYGNSAFWTYDWGDTEIRWTWKSFTTGFGFQSPWLGPAWMNPMLGSNNAPSYPKVDIGFRKTKLYLPLCNWYIGDIEGRIWTGLLTESDYFDNDTSNDKRMLNAMSLSFAPSIIPRFVIGFNRIYTTKWKAKNLAYLARFFTMSIANDVEGDGEDGKISIFANWMFDKIGFEVYGEYGIDDFPSRYSVNPFHTAVYTVGIKQVFPICKNKNIKCELICELNNFEMSQDFQFQWPYGGYYTHGKIIQGYTNKGQILGAGSGYAGNNQFFGLKIYYAKGNTFIYFHRSCPDNNYLYSQSVGTPVTEENLHTQSFKTIMAFGIEQKLFIKENLFITFGGAFLKLQYEDYINNSPTHGATLNASVKYNF